MLKINNIETEILKSEIRFSNHSTNGIKDGYIGYIQIKFKIQNNNGFFGFYLNKISDKEISYYENKEYFNVPKYNNEEINYLEIADTNNFYDIHQYNNKMKVQLGNIEKNKIKVHIEIQEEFISIFFNDYLNIK